MVGTGADGWHVDGYFTEKPFLMNVIHFYEASEGGETWISPLKELVESLEPEVREAWEQLYFVCGSHELSGKHVRGFTQNVKFLFAQYFKPSTTQTNKFYQPLICKHPVTGDPTMVFHLGKNKCEGLCDPQQKHISKHKMTQLLQELSEKLHQRKLRM
jgi:alpha-ketoglutarate-dependent taurine dioxygenase